MGLVKDVRILITGQVPEDYNDKVYELLLARLKVICIEYDLKLDDDY